MCQAVSGRPPSNAGANDRFTAGRVAARSSSVLAPRGPPARLLPRLLKSPRPVAGSLLPRAASRARFRLQKAAWSHVLKLDRSTPAHGPRSAASAPGAAVQL